LGFGVWGPSFGFWGSVVRWRGVIPAWTDLKIVRFAA